MLCWPHLCPAICLLQGHSSLELALAAQLCAPSHYSMLAVGENLNWCSPNRYHSQVMEATAHSTQQWPFQKLPSSGVGSCECKEKAIWSKALEKFSAAFPEYLWALHRKWKCWKSREWPGSVCPVLVFNSFSAARSPLLFIWGISGIGTLSPGVLLRNRACFRPGVGHQLLSCLDHEESLLQAPAFTAGVPPPSGISSLPGWVLALISGDPLNPGFFFNLACTVCWTAL